MELMLRKFHLPKIKNCLLEEYNQKALLSVSLFCFGSDASIWGLRISLLSFGFLYLISALLLVKKVDVSFAFAYCVSKSSLEDQSHFFLRKDLPSVPSSLSPLSLSLSSSGHDALEKTRIIYSERLDSPMIRICDCRLFSPFARRSQSSSVYNNNCCNHL